MKQFNGEVLFLDRSDINTDEIIPAKYLTENTKQALKPYVLEDLTLNGFDNTRDIAGKAAIITRENFGCGSSREHAPWALEVNGINTVIAVNFARIFRQNMFNNGMPAIELPAAEIDALFADFAGKKTRLKLDLDKASLVFEAEGKQKEVSFELSDFNKELVKAGGWINYADKKY